MAKKKTQTTQRVYVLSNGERYNVINEDGKYYICECGTQFRKSAHRGKLIKESVDAPVAETEE